MENEDAVKVAAEVCVPSAKLSSREGEIMDLLSKGYANKQVAGTLGLSPNTVDTYVRRIFAKLNVHCRALAIVAWMSQRT